jgi:sugar phosphate permease
MASSFVFLLYHFSVLGSILMIMGLYILLWGKNRDASVTVASVKEEEEEEEEDKEKQTQS